jgi:hypothetical protein
MIVLYQIGDVPVFHTFCGIDGNPISFDTPRDWKYPEEELSGVGGSISYLPLTRTLPQRPQFKITGNIKATAPYPVTRTMNALTALGGRRNIPIIAFQLENPMQNDEKVSSLIWLVTDCTITGVEPTNSYNDNSAGHVFEYGQLSLTLKAGMVWKALSPWLWEYRDPLDYIVNPYSDENSQIGVDNYFHHPQQFSDLRECFYFYRWQNALSRYNPTFWGLAFSGGIPGGYGSNFVDFGTYEFYSDPQLWNAPPSSVYAFTGLRPTGSISITTRKATGLFTAQYVDEQSTLSLSDLDDDLATAGYGGLQESDIVFTGAMAPFPGFVYRDGARLMGFSPKWSYQGSYPGETTQGYNTVLFGSKDTTGQVAFLHEYGLL